MEAAVAFVFGLLIGSFLNVCIHRWPRGRSVVRPRSHCVRCRKTIPWYDNLPVVSYLMLGGKCRFCKRHISIRYPLVELATGLLFAYFWLRPEEPLLALKMCVFTAILLALTFSDLEKRILPDELTLGGAVIGFIFAFFVPMPGYYGQLLLSAFGVQSSGRAQWVAESVLGAVVPTFFLWAAGWLYFRIRHKEGLGLGDVKLLVMVGSFLGLIGSLDTLILGSIGGSIVGLLFIKLTRKDASNYELPFGTFLGLAGLAVAVFRLAG